jgi:hypothetical protein
VNQSVEFSDQPLIDHITERLWGAHEFGRATVMVGSGFSSNADPISADVGSFPMWSDLTSRMFHKLYPPGSVGLKERRAYYLSSAGAARLADEYRTYLGQSALDELLLDAVPDNQYRPGRLHEMLLSLPWADVFTTNWDTLLERAAERIYDRKYGVVLSASDIPAQERPRIVKLHGSFPSHRPFVVTEEDFRIYPAEHASFVNLVQQSAMENTFCLIGFSGDDPNFLRWSGWVRDHLGDSAPQIYLCGLLDLSPSLHKLLKKRNVVPVDLSSLFPLVDWPDRGERHRKALEWLLLSLHERKPPDADEWLRPSERRARWTSNDSRLPKIPCGSQRYTRTEVRHPSLWQSVEEQLQELQRACTDWQRQREEYPGWIIAPRHKRQQLFEDTEYLIDHSIGLADKLPPPENLSLLYELNWRLEAALIPLFNHWSGKIEGILNVFNPYPGMFGLEGASLTPQTADHDNLDWGIIADQWVELAFAVAREAREDQTEERFRKWMDRLATVADRKAEWQARWFYEEGLFRLFSSDYEGFRTILEEWPEDLGPPFWDVKHAGLLSELGELKEAERIAGTALLNIRDQLQPSGGDLALLSQEGWAMALLERIRANYRGAREGDEIYRERYRELEAHRCNPFTEIESAVSRVSGPPPAGTYAHAATRGTFDPGRARTSIRFGGGLPLAPFFPAFGFLRMLEEGASPLRCGGDRLESEAVVSSARWIEQLAPFWSLSALLRIVDTGKEDELEPWFGRVRVATLPPRQVEALYSIFEAGFDQAVSRLDGNPEELRRGSMSFAVRQAKVLSYMLSRISIRLTEAQRTQMFERVIGMYERPLFRQSIELHDCVKLVFGRLLSQAMSQEEIVRRVNRLLALPIAEEDDFRMAATSKWPEPMEHISWEPGSRLDVGFDRSSWGPHIKQLLSITRHGSDTARRQALQRLVAIHQLDALIEEESKSFGEALWSRTDINGFPSGMTHAFRFSFLALPHPASIDVEALFRRYALSLNFSQVVSADGSLNLNIPYEHIALECHGGRLPMAGLQPERRQGPVAWSADDARIMLQRMWERWNEEKDTLTQHLSGGFDLGFMDSLRTRFGDWILLLADTILPQLKDAIDETKDRVQDLVTGLEEIGLTTSYVYPATLFLDETVGDPVANRLWENVTSHEPIEVEQATNAIVLWLTLRELDNQIPEPPDHLLEEIVNRTVARRMPGLGATLSNLLYVLHHSPDILRLEHLRHLCVGLRYLLEDTYLPAPSEQPGITEAYSSLPVGERTRYRQHSAALASAISRDLQRRGQQIPEILKVWERVGREDPLPEVRRAWRVNASPLR